MPSVSIKDISGILDLYSSSPLSPETSLVVSSNQFKKQSIIYNISMVNSDKQERSCIVQ